MTSASHLWSNQAAETGDLSLGDRSCVWRKYGEKIVPILNRISFSRHSKHILLSIKGRHKISG